MSLTNSKRMVGGLSTSAGRHGLFTRLCASLGVALVIGGAPAWAQEEDERYRFVVLDVALSQFLVMLGDVSGEMINLDDVGREELNELVLEGTVEEVLNAIAEQARVEVFTFNEAYYVAGRESNVTRFIWLSDLAVDEVLASVESAGLDVARFPLRVADNQRTIILTAPPRYVALFEEALEPLLRNRPTREEFLGPQARSVVVRRGVTEELVELRETD